MRKLQLGVIVAFAAAVLVVWMMRQQTLLQLQHQSDALKQMQAALEELQGENTKLSSQLAEASPTPEQLTELLKLRAEVTRLRGQTNEIRQLRAQNLQLMQSRRAPASGTGLVGTTNAPPDVPPQDNHPRDTWSFVGYATPDATVQTMLWSMTQTNVEGFLAGFAPEMRPEIESHLTNDAVDLQEKMSQNTGFRVVDRKSISDDEMDLTIYVDGDDHTDTTRFKRINGEWKIVR